MNERRKTALISTARREEQWRTKKGRYAAEPETLAIVAGALMLVLTTASLIPALRAAKIDPINRPTSRVVTEDRE